MRQLIFVSSIVGICGVLIGFSFTHWSLNQHLRQQPAAGQIQRPAWKLAVDARMKSQAGRVAAECPVGMAHSERLQCLVDAYLRDAKANADDMKTGL